jgi:NAD dependent epimerase/dehydratase family enzyme
LIEGGAWANLARDGGFLQRLLLPFKLGLGGPIGNRKQWMPWIHLHDQVALVDFPLNQPNARGPYNACAPNPQRNADFTRSLAASLHCPACLAVLLRLGLGELSGLLLGGQRALPV